MYKISWAHARWRTRNTSSRMRDRGWNQVTSARPKQHPNTRTYEEMSNPQPMRAQPQYVPSRINTQKPWSITYWFLAKLGCYFMWRPLWLLNEARKNKDKRCGLGCYTRPQEGCSTCTPRSPGCNLILSPNLASSPSFFLNLGSNEWSISTYSLFLVRCRREHKEIIYCFIRGKRDKR